MKNQLKLYLFLSVLIAIRTKTHTKTRKLMLPGAGGAADEVKADKMLGGMLNIQMPKEGAPIYIDQSPSYIYHDPLTPYNQNGVRMPLTSPAVVPHRDELIKATFKAPNPFKVKRPSRFLQKGIAFPMARRGGERKLKGENVFNIHNFSPPTPNQSMEERIDPSGTVIDTALPVIQPDREFEIEGSNELDSNFSIQEELSETSKLLTIVRTKMTNLKAMMKAKEAKIDSTIDDIYNINMIRN